MKILVAGMLYTESQFLVKIKNKIGGHFSRYFMEDGYERHKAPSLLIKHLKELDECLARHEGKRILIQVGSGTEQVSYGSKFCEPLFTVKDEL